VTYTLAESLLCLVDSVLRELISDRMTDIRLFYQVVWLVQNLALTDAEIIKLIAEETQIVNACIELFVFNQTLDVELFV
jgi:hypothetical protein